jgi:amino acid adenylation domain-containing protein
MTGSLVTYLRRSTARRPDHAAVEEGASEQSATYAGLDTLSDRVRDWLIAIGVTKGDRVGVYVRKSIDSYAAILGTMKAGAVYVPVDAAAPPWRSAFILHDCAVRAVVLESKLLQPWREETAKLGSDPVCLTLDAVGGGVGLSAALDHAPSRPSVDVAVGPDDLAYLLYTSGSTGKPKGVMLTHRNAMAYVDWCSNVFQPTDADRFSSHAPFHFDLSILDLYVPLKHGATVVLIGTDQGKEPTGLARLIAERRLTIWYSTPTILTMLAQFGHLEQYDLSALRFVLFAGEVFPVKHLREVKSLLTWPRFYNLYGPTETNVCTYHLIPDVIEADRTTPYPIGKVCEQLRARVVDLDNEDVARGVEGELLIAGDNVMQGYWNLPDRSVQAFVVDSSGTRWYHTGDMVIEDVTGVFDFVGRRDRMVKRRGYRIELGEIEAGMYRHPGVREAAAISLRDASGDVRIKVILAMAEGEKRSVISLKKFCADTLPVSMIPDLIEFVDALPKTSTDKVDYQRLAAVS